MEEVYNPYTNQQVYTPQQETYTPNQQYVAPQQGQTTWPPQAPPPPVVNGNGYQAPAAPTPQQGQANGQYVAPQQQYPPQPPVQQQAPQTPPQGGYQQPAPQQQYQPPAQAQGYQQPPVQQQYAQQPPPAQGYQQPAPQQQAPQQQAQTVVKLPTQSGQPVGGMNLVIMEGYINSLKGTQLPSGDFRLGFFMVWEMQVWENGQAKRDASGNIEVRNVRHLCQAWGEVAMNLSQLREGTPIKLYGQVNRWNGARNGQQANWVTDIKATRFELL